MQGIKESARKEAKSEPGSGDPASGPKKKG
jgi:hypothetical protein